MFELALALKHEPCMLAEIHRAGRRECSRSEPPSLLRYLSVVVRPNMAASLILANPVGSFGFGTPPEGRNTY
jgi:hypothetical protein